MSDPSALGSATGVARCVSRAVSQGRRSSIASRRVQRAIGQPASGPRHPAIGFGLGRRAGSPLSLPRTTPGAALACWSRGTASQTRPGSQRALPCGVPARDDRRRLTSEAARGDDRTKQCGLSRTGQRNCSISVPLERVRRRAVSPDPRGSTSLDDSCAEPRLSMSARCSGTSGCLVFSAVLGAGFPDRWWRCWVCCSSQDRSGWLRRIRGGRRLRCRTARSRRSRAAPVAV
jgi:hypothetical protein